MGAATNEASTSQMIVRRAGIGSVVEESIHFYQLER